VQVTVYTIGGDKRERTAQLIAPPMGGAAADRLPRRLRAGGQVRRLVVDFDRPRAQTSRRKGPLRPRAGPKGIVNGRSENSRVQVAARRRRAACTSDYDVGRAELEAQRKRMVGAIIAQQNLMQARGRRKHRRPKPETEAKIARGRRASLRWLFREKRNKRASRPGGRVNIEMIRIAPVDGLVTLRRCQAFAPRHLLRRRHAGDRVGDPRQGQADCRRAPPRVFFPNSRSDASCRNWISRTSVRRGKTAVEGGGWTPVHGLETAAR